MTAPLPMGGQKITGMADPSVSTDAVTKNYADSLVAAFFSTGDVKLTLKLTADTGWVLLTSSSFGNGTIGSGGSGANIRANADCVNLFTLVYNNFQEADAPVTTSTGSATTRAAQGSAATAWAANCRVQIGFFAGRVIGVSGAPSDLATARALGAHTGTETVAIVAANIPTITSSGANAISVTSTVSTIGLFNGGLGGITASGGTSNLAGVGTSGSAAGVTSNNGAQAISVTYTNASPTAISQFQPSVFINAMVRL